MKEKELIQEKAYLYWLSQTPEFGAVTLRRLWEHFHSFVIIYNIEETQLEELGLIKSHQNAPLRRWKEQLNACLKSYEQLEERNIRYITPLDPDYPTRLRNIYNYPMGLFVKGELPKENQASVAIVGARGCSSYGRQVAEEFARALSEEQVQIISGLATGIDGAAHSGAIRAGYPTFGVLGCGVNICYPSVNYGLFETMVTCGGILSEYPPGTKPNPQYFPMRNRIISGLSDAILVVEAKEKSGSLITAELGLEQGREIFAVPGRVTDRLSCGCNQLIRQGAGIALSPDDLLEYLGIKREKKLVIREKSGNRLAKKEKMVYSCLDLKAKHLDEIATACQLGVSECMGILFALEMNGYVIQTANQYYGKNIQK